ncbi:MAG: response regulator transcription factor, partial [Bacteroidia bacterium]|nr:response regulator transcription factor [Bacteroidia bacterium]
MEKVIKVVVADDHQMIIDGIKAFFIENENIHLLDSANSGEELFRILADKKVDIVITDINMPGMDGIEITRNIKKQYPNIKVIALSMYIDKNLITEMINAGAHGYVLINTGKQDLI